MYEEIDERLYQKRSTTQGIKCQSVFYTDTMYHNVSKVREQVKQMVAITILPSGWPQKHSVVRKRSMLSHLTICQISQLS